MLSRHRASPAQPVVGAFAGGCWGAFPAAPELSAQLNGFVGALGLAALEHHPYRHIRWPPLYPRGEKVGRRLADETRRPPARHPGNPDLTAIAVTDWSYEVVPMRTAFLEEHEAQPV
jgi:hypothetical protein